MTSSVNGVPDGASAVIPRLFCRDPEAEIEFCTGTFRAVELNRRPDAAGKDAHALIKIGPAMVMIESEWSQLANRAPSPDGSSPVALYLYVEDVDATVARAEAAGGSSQACRTVGRHDNCGNSFHSSFLVHSKTFVHRRPHV